MLRRALLSNILVRRAVRISTKLVPVLLPTSLLFPLAELKYLFPNFCYLYAYHFPRSLSKYRGSDFLRRIDRLTESHLSPGVPRLKNVQNIKLDTHAKKKMSDRVDAF